MPAKTAIRTTMMMLLLVVFVVAFVVVVAKTRTVTRNAMMMLLACDASEDGDQKQNDSGVGCKNEIEDANNDDDGADDIS